MNKGKTYTKNKNRLERQKDKTKPNQRKNP